MGYKLTTKWKCEVTLIDWKLGMCHQISLGVNEPLYNNALNILW